MQQLLRGILGLSHLKVSGGHAGMPYAIEAEAPERASPWPQFGPLGEVMLAHPIVGPRLREAALASQSVGEAEAAAARLMAAAGDLRAGPASWGSPRVGERAGGAASGFGGSVQDAAFSSEEEEAGEEASDAGAHELASVGDGAVAGGSAGLIPSFRAQGSQKRSAEAMRQRNARKKARRREKAMAAGAAEGGGKRRRREGDKDMGSSGCLACSRFDGRRRVSLREGRGVRTGEAGHPGPTSETPEGAVIVFFDGASKGDKTGGAGIVAHTRTEESPDGAPVFAGAVALERVNNNAAEWAALLYALCFARAIVSTALTHPGLEADARPSSDTNGVSHVLIHGDSELVINQMLGKAVVNLPNLQRARKAARALLAHIRAAGTVVRFAHVRRELNAQADSAANAAVNAMREGTLLPGGCLQWGLEDDTPAPAWLPELECVLEVPALTRSDAVFRWRAPPGMPGWLDGTTCVDGLTRPRGSAGELAHALHAAAQSGIAITLDAAPAAPETPPGNGGAAAATPRAPVRPHGGDGAAAEVAATPGSSSALRGAAAPWTPAAPRTPGLSFTPSTGDYAGGDGDDGAVAATQAAPRREAAPGCSLAGLPAPPPTAGGGAAAASGVSLAGAGARARAAIAAAAIDDGAPPAPPSNARARPALPAVGPAGDGMAAIDAVSVDDILESPFAHVQSIDSAQHEAWAHASVDVFTAISDAAAAAPGPEGSAELDRALKWLLVYHQVLLRVPPRGGRRGAGVIPKRFDLWRDGDFERLLQWWRQDRAAARSEQRVEAAGAARAAGGTPDGGSDDEATAPPRAPVRPGVLSFLGSIDVGAIPDIGAVRAGMGRRVRFAATDGDSESGESEPSDDGAAAGGGGGGGGGAAAALAVDPRERARKAHRARHLIAEGELSRAVRELESKGMGNLSDSAIQAQLERKHKARRPEDELPESLLEYAAMDDDDDSARPDAERCLAAFGPRVEVKLQESMRKLRRMRGTGVTGFRNEYLKALSENFEDQRAKTVVPLIEEFAERFVNADLPAWFYYAYATVEECAPIKEAGVGGEPPDCRPVGKGECLPRMINSKLVADNKGAAYEALWPWNVGTAVTDGCGILAHGLRLATELRPDWVLINLDIKNAHNELLRRIALLRLMRTRGLRHLVPAYYAQYAPKSRIYFRGCQREVIRATFDSEEAWRQGCPLAQLGFNVAILEEVKALDAALAAHGGFARFNHDDGYAFGPANVVFRAVADFERSLEPLGLELQGKKSTCYSRETDLSGKLAELGKPDLQFPVPVALRDEDTGALCLGKRDDEGRLFKAGEKEPSDDCEVVGVGCVVAGVPVGDQGFVRTHLMMTVGAAASKTRNITSMLSPECHHSLHTLNVRCLQPILSYWAQHVYSRHVVGRLADSALNAQPPAVAMDDALFACEARALGLTDDVDDETRLRVRLPARHLGCALRRHAESAHVAFAASVVKIAPRLVRSRDSEGMPRVGFIEALATPVFGAGAFDSDDAGEFEWGGEDRFATFLRSGLPYANAFRSAWSRGVEMLRPDGCDSGTLAAPVESAGLVFEDGRAVSWTRKPQRQLTVELEVLRRDALDRRMRQLPNDDMRRLAWLNCDKTSTVWVHAVPNDSDRLTTAELAEVGARYLGLPSPACSTVLGARVGVRQTVDRFGFALSSASMPGDGWRRMHDVMKWRMWNDAREMGQYAAAEVYGLFAAAIPQQARDAVASLHPRKRHGLVPDFMMRISLPDSPPEEKLLELKVVHLARSHYRLTDRYENGERKTPVKRRAAKVPRDYVYKAQKADQRYCGTAPGSVGPIEQKLRSYAHVVPLVFGAYGETSDGVELLLGELAEAGAERHWRRMKARRVNEAKGALAWLLRRRWGINAVRENARLVLDRLQYVNSDTRRQERSLRATMGAENRARARYDALEFATLGPSLVDSRPPDATRWA